MIMTRVEKLLMNNRIRRWIWEKKEFPIIRELVPPDPGSTFLELGAGMGFGSASLLREYPQAELVATDFDPSQLERGRRYLSRQGFDGRVTLQQADAAALPFEAESFDMVFAFGMMHHVEQYMKALHEVHRVLRPSGRLVVMDSEASIFRKWGWLFPPAVTFTEEEFEQAMRQAGLTIEDRRRLAGFVFFLSGAKM